MDTVFIVRMFLDQEAVGALTFQAIRALVAQEDRVRFYQLCANCVSKVETVGEPPPADEILFLV